MRTGAATASLVSGEGVPPDTRPGLLVFTRALLPRSETFVEDHVRSLRRYRPVLAGLTPVPDGLRVNGIATRIVGRNGTGLERLSLAFSPRRGALDRLAAEMNAKVIHAHFLVNALMLVPLVRRCGLPLLVTAHGHDVSAHPSTLRPVDRLLYATRLKALGAHADAILCVSDTIRELAIERGLPPERCLTMPLGIPLDRFADVHASPVPGRLLFVGRLVEKKGLSYLLDAVAGVRAQGHRLDLHIIGDGPQRAALEAQNMRLGTQARFLGAQPRARVLKELGEAWAFTMPSRRAADGDSEGLPIVFLEAQAAGVPVIAFDNGPAREAILDEETGLLAPEGDVGALSQRIARLLADPGLRVRLAAAAKARVATKFDITERTAALERVYDDVAGRHRATGARRQQTSREEVCA